MPSRRLTGRAGALAAGMAVPAVAVTLGASHVHRLNRQTDALRNLQDLAEAFASHAAELPGYPFTNSEDAVRALVEAGHLKPEQTVGCTTGRPLVLAPAILSTPEGVVSSAANDPRTIVAYEPLPADEASPACLLFADGHGECVPAEKHDAMLKPVAANR